MQPDDASALRDMLHKHGHLHIFLESGQEFAISRGDTAVEEGYIEIDSRDGHWTIGISRVEYVDIEPSGPHGGH